MRVAAWLFGVSIGCASQESALDLAQPPADEGTDADAETAAPEDDALPPSDAPYWSLNAWFATPGPSFEDFSMEVTIWREPGHPECLFDAQILDVVPTTPPEGEDLPVWFRVSFVADEICRYGGPTTVELGIGPWDAALDGPARALDLDGPKYGAYLRSSAQAPLWVFGAALTDGLADPPPDVPPDGAWHLRTLHLLPR